MERHVCIHGHFYQPPRENPWLEAIELQDSAYPYHDWNERITAECYGPNARSRILDDRGRVAALVNNYARISFNVGPTLLAWMEAKAPDVYEAVVRADAESAERFGGHGSAIAQAYNHVILPLASERDRVTQVRWGLRDFEHRFGRPAAGMWLPETAADTASLDVLAAEGVQFAVLAPHQAARVRAKGQRKWHDVGEGGIDTTVPYLAPLPSGRSVVVFFYDGPLSRAVAFEQLLSDGNRFAERLLGALPSEADGPRLAHIATDGETYGHHHRHGDMALAYALQRVEESDASLTNYGQFLELRPPEHEVQIADLTSWSCAHGVERWRSDCGCNTGRGWSQAWRAPLRQALDWLRAEVDPVYEERGGALLGAPWGARDDYIEVVLDRSPARVEKFLDTHAARPLEEGERIDVLKLLEMQRHAMLMYTSCGWFFDELSGIETVQVLQYAARTIQLAEELTGRSLEEAFLERIDEAESNVREYGRGRAVYDRFVRPAMVDLTKVGAHWAATTLVGDDAERGGSAAGTEPLFRGYTDRERVYCYDIEREDIGVLDAGAARLSVGRVRVTSEVTRENAQVSFGAVYLGDHNLNVGARPFLGADAYEHMVADVTEAFDQGDLPEVVRRLDRHFGEQHYSLRTLFRDEQRQILDRILGATLEESAEAQRRLYEREIPLIRFLAGINVPLPRAFLATAQVVVDDVLAKEFSSTGCDPHVVRDVLSDTAGWGLELDVASHAYRFAGTLRDVADQVRRRPADRRLSERLESLVDLASSLPWPVDLAETQNAFYCVVHDHYERLRERGDDRADTFARIAEKLSLALPG